MNGTNAEEDLPYQRSLKHIVSLVPKLKQELSVNGKKIKSVRFVHDEATKGEAQFQSVAVFGTIVREYENSETDNISVIIKMQICDESSLKFNNGGIQFINEVLLYNDFLPYFSTVVSDIQDLFPKFVYGYVSTDNRFEDIIILENLSLEKYRLATSRTQLSLEHILMALRGLGKFHACSYIMKSIDKDTFLAKVNAVRDIRNWVTDPKDSFQNFIVKNCERGFKYLASLEEYKDKLDNVRQFLANPAEWFPRLFEVNDRTSVLCHGDFCRNNMFFKYEDSGRPVNVKFFDMATIIHASPVLDIAFFLYLNTGQDQRVQHWDQMIHSYYDSLKQTCESCHHTVEFPTYEEILDEFKPKAMLGYLSCSFFLPVMMQKVQEDRSKWGKLNDEEIIQLRLSTSGEEGTKAVGEILKHIIDNGFM